MSRTPLLLALAGLLAAASDRPPFCGPPEVMHRVLKEPEGTRPPPLEAGKARLYIFWRGSPIRMWMGAQCKVAMKGQWVAALVKNTYTAVDVDPGKVRLCGMSVWRTGPDQLPTWRSLLFLHALPGESYYVECSPGGDAVGAPEPTLSQLDVKSGAKVIRKHRLVRFEIREDEEEEKKK